MFKRLEDGSAERITMTIDGASFKVPPTETVAAALLVSDPGHTRTTPVSGAPRAPFCLMGACYECLVVIDGQPNQRACREPVREGMAVERQHRVGSLPG